jgi:hypothetical protein
MPADDPADALENLLFELEAKGYAPSLNNGDGTNYFVSLWHDANRRYRVFCRPRASEGGTLWLFEDGGTPISAADDLNSATAHITARVPRPGR